MAAGGAVHRGQVVVGFLLLYEKVGDALVKGARRVLVNRENVLRLEPRERVLVVQQRVRLDARDRVVVEGDAHKRAESVRLPLKPGDG